MLPRKSISLTRNPLTADFDVRQYMASCILSTSKCFQCLKTLALAGGRNTSEVGISRITYNGVYAPPTKIQSI